MSIHNLESEIEGNWGFYFYEGDFAMWISLLYDQTTCTREIAYLKHQKDSDLPLI